MSGERRKSPPGGARARSRGRRPILVAATVLGVGLAIGLAMVAVRASAEARSLATGAALFEGRSPLAARIGGHVDRLPPAMVACANCHRPTPAASASPGPVLSRDLLLAPVARRGGPPSRFDRGAFCRLLETGEDPAGVLLPRAMPRYDIDPAACDALWRFVIRS
jgi:hypothetical protein